MGIRGLGTGRAHLQSRRCCSPAPRPAAQAHARRLARHCDLRQRHHVERALRLGTLRGAGGRPRPARAGDRGRRAVSLPQGLRRGGERAAAKRWHLHGSSQYDEQTRGSRRGLSHAAVLHRNGRHQRDRGDALRPPSLGRGRCPSGDRGSPRGLRVAGHHRHQRIRVRRARDLRASTSSRSRC